MVRVTRYGPMRAGRSVIRFTVDDSRCDVGIDLAKGSDAARRGELTNGGEFQREMVVGAVELGRNVTGHGSQDMPAWGDAFKGTSQSEAEVTKKVSEVVEFLFSIQN